MNSVKYFLVLEKRLGDYNYIDINKLDICNETVTNDLTSIDSFTNRFTEEELRNSISRSNMARPEYLDGNLKVVSDAKHNLRVLTKTVFDEVMQIVTGKLIIDRDLKNRLFGLFRKIIEKLYDDKGVIAEMLEKFKSALRMDNLVEIFNYINLLPYPQSRSIYFMIYDELQIRKEITVKKLEKPDNE